MSIKYHENTKKNFPQKTVCPNCGSNEIEIFQCDCGRVFCAKCGSIEISDEGVTAECECGSKSFFYSDD